MSQKRLAYGVAYSPNDTTPPFVIRNLPKTDVKYVRVQWVDFSNQIRYKVLSRPYFLKLLGSSDRPGITTAAATLGIVAGAASSGFSGIGEWLYVFDLDTLRWAGYEATGHHAVVMGYYQEEIPHPNAGVHIAVCPRTILGKVVRDAEDAAGIRFLAGVEHEFVLLSATSPATAINSADWCVSSKLSSHSREAKVLEEIADVLQKSGVELQMYHAEAAPGQYEVITGPLSPLQAADTVIYTRETIYSIASKHGLRATFATRVRPGAFTAAHTHLSVHDIDLKTQTFGEQKPFKHPSFGPTLTSTERSFLQGILSELPSLLALTYPTPFSYDRVQDGMWTGGPTVCWGTDHREAPIRLTGAPGGHHFEIRCVDGTASPYLTLAALLAAGAAGVKKKLPLTFGDCRKAVINMTAAERAEVGLENPKNLPKNIVDARDAMGKSDVIRNAFGDEFITKYRLVNEELEKHLTAVDGEERITRLVTMY
ncbi:FLU1-II [Cristinia sonorae]|uniref:FLU1-II n=1 Tax=Cristinia sonorae TaxID=1940300 RepID=A0A8K0XM43_9AGAR|nr:FLU1-II [Cristinia sonorae]